MRLLICAVGRVKAGAERELLSRYLGRAAPIARSTGVGAIETVEIAESRGRSADQRRREEATLIRGRLPPGASVVVLDESGDNLDSAAFATLVATERDAGRAALVFVIGGPDGLEPAWRDGQRTLAFGAATFPHQLVRVLLAEQLYRAFTILSGHPYHRA